MVDNVTLPGTGKEIAADDVGSVYYQKIKLDLGGDGASDPVDGEVPTVDAGPDWTPVRTYTTSADMTSAANISAAPTAGQKVVMDDLIFSTDTSMLFKVQEETSGTVFMAIQVTAGVPVQITPRDGLKAAVADKRLQGLASVAGNVYITLCQHSEA